MSKIISIFRLNQKYTMLIKKKEVYCLLLENTDSSTKRVLPCGQQWYLYMLNVVCDVL